MRITRLIFFITTLVLPFLTFAADNVACIDEPVVETKENSDKFDVTLTASCTTAPTGKTISSYKWLIYSAGRLEAIEVGKIYERTLDNNIYVATLVVTDNTGEKSTTSTTFSNNPDELSLLKMTFDYEVDAGEVQFNAREITGLQYQWWSDNVLPDAIATQEAQPNLSLPKTTHTITMVVLNEANTIKTAYSQIIEVKGELPPIATFQIKPLSNYSVANEGVKQTQSTISIELDASDSYDPDGGPEDGDISHYLWGSSRGNENTPLEAEKTTFYLLNDFAHEGTQFSTDFYLFVTDNEGEKNEDDGISGSLQQSLHLPNPIATFTGEKNQNKIPLVMNLDASESKSTYSDEGEIIYYEWYLNGQLEKAGSDAAQHEMVIGGYGTHKVFLQVIDSYGLSSTVEKTVFLTPELPDPIAIDNTGNFSETDALFAGGVRTENKPLSHYVQATSAETVSFEANIEIDPDHVGQKGDLLVVLAIDNNPPYDGGIDTQYYVYDSKRPIPNIYAIDLYGEATGKDGWLSYLTSYVANIELEKTMLVDLSFLNKKPFEENSPFNQQAMYYIFIGYRLDDGTIIYSSSPIRLNVPY